MSDTSGQRCSASLRSVRLQSFLASRLQVNLASRGSTEYDLTWKPSTTPAGWPYCQLAASARRTGGIESSGWPTANVRDHKDVGENTNYAAAAARSKLGGVVHQAGWPTARVQASRVGGLRGDFEKGHNGNLEEVVHLLQVAVLPASAWPTPTKMEAPLPPDIDLETWNGLYLTKPNGKKHQTDLRITALAAAGWPTATVAAASVPSPTRLEKLASEGETTRNVPTGGEPQNLNERVLTHLGATASGLTAQTVRDGVFPTLNKEFTRWLQGYPEQWSRSAPTAMR